MGLFSSKKTTSISSVLYNLAGDIDNRPNFLKTTLIGAVFANDLDKGLGETLVNAHLNGPGMKQRRFFTWAKNNYALGMPTSSITSSFPVDKQLIIDEFPPPEGLVTVVQRAFVEAANYFYLAEKYIFATYPELIDSNWTCDYNSEDNEIIIQYEDTSVEIIDATGYDKFKDYVIAYYYFSKPEESSALELGDPSEFFYDETLLPTFDNYVLDETLVLTNEAVSLNETTVVDVTYSDATPPESTTTVQPYTDTKYEERLSYTFEEYEGIQNSIRPRSRIDTHRVWRYAFVDSTDTVTVVEEDMGGGVTKTTTTTETVEFLAPRWKYRDDVYYNYPDERVGEYKIMVYRLGGARTALNGLQTESAEDLQEFFPFIPLRIKNSSIDEDKFGGGILGFDLGGTEYGEDFYPACNAAYRKLTGDNISKILDSVNDNESIDDIDYCFMVFGVPLNAKDRAGKRYLYQFFRNLIPFQGTSGTDYENFLLEKDLHQGAISNYEDWYTQQQNTESARYGTPAPAKSTLTTPQFTTINIKSNDERVESYDMRLNWVTIKEEIIQGKIASNIKYNDIRMSHGPSDVWEEEIGTLTESGDNKQYDVSEIHNLYIDWQDTDDSYRRLTVRGLVHQNFVYDGRSVDTHSKDALADLDESALLIPMHNPTMRELSIVDSTQLTTCNTFLIFNCYKVTKQKWYQKGIFKVIFVIAIAVITVYFAPAGAVTGGILGTNAAVGGLLGLSGTSALLVGAAVNAIAAMILTSLISEVSVKLFGAKWGAVIGAIAGFVAMQGMTSYMTDGQIGMNWGNMMRMDNLLQLTNVGVNAYSGWARADILETYAEMEAAQKEYETESAALNEKMQDLTSSGAVINPMMFTNAFEDVYTDETSSEFIGRTTMVGTDLIDLSYSMIYDYVAINLQLPDS
jgi:hypothetical protein